MLHDHVDTITMAGHGWFGLVFWLLIVMLLIAVFSNLFGNKN